VAFNFLACDRDQELLLPPSLRDWLPEDHLAWFLIDAVAEIDLSAFLADYREDGWGRPAFDPEVMVALLLYAYAVGERSSRAIERRCREDVAFRVITANAVPDHATIARFRQRHEQALAGVFTGVLRLCAEAGLLSVGLVALDGTKLKANASKDANRSYAEVSREVERMLAEAAEADAAEDARLGAARGDELPDELAERTSRKARLRQAKAKLKAQGREQRIAYEAHLAERARMEAERGRPLRGRKPKPPAEAPAASARVNTTDPDSGLMRTREGFVQGYNAQAVVAEGQLIVAAELSTDSPDGRLLQPMVEAARAELAAVGLAEAPAVVLADAGYWNVPQIESVLAGGRDVLVSPVSATQGIPAALGQPRKPRAKRMLGRCLEMHEKLSTPAGRELYARRKQLVEPVFAQTKVVRRADRFQRRGLAACRSEWRLIAATHNLLKLWRCQQAGAHGKDPLPDAL
jgi:transposase